MYSTAQTQNLLSGERLAAKPPRYYLVFAAFVTFTAVMLLAGAGSVLRIAYPIGSVLVALFLYVKHKPLYIGFVMWMWFLSAFVRRLVDGQAGFQEPSPVLLAPYLVTAVSGLALVTKARSLALPRSIPFVLALSAIAYGIVVGATQFPLLKMLTAIINWVVPIFLAFCLVECHEQYDEIRQVVTKSFLYATIVMGAYSIYQFFIFPAWDKLWLQNMRTTTFGSPEPMEIRAFSTMHAPVVFGLTIMCTLLVVLGAKGKIKFLAGGCGLAGLALSLNRSAWLGFTVGAAFVVWQMSMRDKLRIVTALLVCALISPAILLVPGTNDLLVEKVGTFGNISSDVSYQARVEGYMGALNTLAQEPFGEGVASPELAHRTLDNDDAIGPHDSLFLELLYSLGWLGTACYLAAIAIVLVQGFTNTSTKGMFETLMKAIMIALLAQSLLNDFVMGAVGAIFWIAGGMLLAAVAKEKSEARVALAEGQYAGWLDQPLQVQNVGR